MNGATVAALVVAGLSVLGAISSVALLAFRVGALVGMLKSHVESSDADRARIWKSLGEVSALVGRHVEIYHGGRGSNVRS